MNDYDISSSEYMNINDDDTSKTVDTISKNVISETLNSKRK